MSTRNRNTGNRNQEEQKITREESTSSIRIDVEQNEPFTAAMDTMLLKSTGLCDIANSLFSLYADYEGSTFGVVQGTNMPMLELYFNHRNCSDDAVTACSKDVDDRSTRNNTLRSIRTHDRRLYEGDRFYLTPDGKSGLEEFMISQYSLRSIYYRGKDNLMHVDWRKVTAEVADPNSRYYGQGASNQQFTKLSFIDPVAVVSKYFGATDEAGKLEYNVRLVRSLPGINNMTPNQIGGCVIAIERYSEANINKLAKELNLAIGSGLNIHRS